MNRNFAIVISIPAWNDTIIKQVINTPTKYKNGFVGAIVFLKYAGLFLSFMVNVEEIYFIYIRSVSTIVFIREINYRAKYFRSKMLIAKSLLSRKREKKFI